MLRNIGDEALGEAATFKKKKKIELAKLTSSI